MRLSSLLMFLVVPIALVGCAPLPAAQPSSTATPAAASATAALSTSSPATATATAALTTTETTQPAEVTSTVAPASTSTAMPTAAATVTPIPTTTGSAEPLPTVPPGFTTYSDRLAGFAIDYPAEWYITVPSVESRPNAQAYTASIRSIPSLSDQPRGQAFPPDETAIDVTVWRTKAASFGEAVEERRAEIRDSELGTTITSQELLTLAGGLPAVRWQLETAQAGAVAEVTTLLNGNRIMVDGMGNLAQFDAIARSLRPIAQGGSGVAPAIPVGTPGAETTYTDAPLGFSAVIPAEWELCTNTELSRLFCRKQAVPTGPEFPRFYLTVLPSGFTNEDASAYNFIPEDDVKAFMELSVGQSLATGGLPEYSTFTRLPDATVSGLPAVVIENSNVWEGGPNTRDRRVLTKVGTSTYMFGTYYETADQLAEFERALGGVQITAR